MRFTSFFICLVLTSASYAQDSLHVSSAPAQMSHGMQPGYSVDIPQARMKDVVSAWKKYIKRGDTKNSVENNDSEYQMTGTALTNVSQNLMNVYAQVKEAEKAIRVTAYFTEDDTNFISPTSDAEKSHFIVMMMKDFARAQYRLAVEFEMNQETENLEKLEKEKDNLINENEKSDRNIHEYERKIDRAKADIETNGTEQSKRRAEVANQKEVVRSTTPKTETYDLEEKKLNGLEKELKKLEKDGENLHGDIDGWNADIRQLHRNIEKNEDWIREKKDSISKQKDKIRDVKAKLENIR